MTFARPAARTLVVVAGLAALAWLARAGGLFRGWPISRYVVDGPSMEPAYEAGDRLLINRLAYRGRHPKADDVVVLRDPERAGHYLVKRVAFDVDPAEAHVYVLGDNGMASRDSRAFGPVPADLIVGKALLKY